MQQQGENPDPDGRGVSRESHAPFCEGLAGKFRWSTLPSTSRSERPILFLQSFVIRLTNFLMGTGLGDVKFPSLRRTPHEKPKGFSFS